MLEFIRNITSRRDEDGASAVEYGLLVAGIAALIVAVVFLFGGVDQEHLQHHLRQDLRRQPRASSTATCMTDLDGRVHALDPEVRTHSSMTPAASPRPPASWSPDNLRYHGAQVWRRLLSGHASSNAPDYRGVVSRRSPRSPGPVVHRSPGRARAASAAGVRSRRSALAAARSSARGHADPLQRGRVRPEPELAHAGRVVVAERTHGQLRCTCSNAAGSPRSPASAARSARASIGPAHRVPHRAGQQASPPRPGRAAAPPPPAARSLDPGPVQQPPSRRAPAPAVRCRARRRSPRAPCRARRRGGARGRARGRPRRGPPAAARPRPGCRRAPRAGCPRSPET